MPPSPRRVRRLPVHPPALLPVLLPPALLRPDPQSHPRLRQLPPLLLHVPGRLGQQLHGLCPPLHLGGANPLLLPPAGRPCGGGAAEGPVPPPRLRGPDPRSRVLCCIPGGLLLRERYVLLSPGWKDSVTRAGTQAAGSQPGTELPSPAFQNKPLVAFLERCVGRGTSLGWWLRSPPALSPHVPGEPSWGPRSARCCVGALCPFPGTEGP